MIKNFTLKEWRKGHREPGKARTLTRDTAQQIIGLSFDGYANQLAERRPLSRQTRSLMTGWDLMADWQREVFLDATNLLDEAYQVHSRYEYESQSDEKTDQEHFFDCFNSALESLKLHVRWRIEASTDIGKRCEDEQIALCLKELKKYADLLVASGGLDRRQ